VLSSSPAAPGGYTGGSPIADCPGGEHGGRQLQGVPTRNTWEHPWPIGISVDGSTWGTPRARHNHTNRRQWGLLWGHPTGTPAANGGNCHGQGFRDLLVQEWEMGRLCSGLRGVYRLCGFVDDHDVEGTGHPREDARARISQRGEDLGREPRAQP